MKLLKPVFFVIALCTLYSVEAQVPSKKITVYTYDFSGTSDELGVGQYDFMTLTRRGFAVVKSVKVPAGMKVTLYEKDNFQGYSLVLTQDASMGFLEAKGFAKTILSISLVVEELPATSTPGPFVTIYKDDFGGSSKNLTPDQYEHFELDPVGNDNLSSIKIPNGLKVTLYEHGGFKGRTLILTKDTRASFLVSNKFNDLTSSILVEAIPEPTVPVKQEVPTVVEVKPAPTVVTTVNPVVEEKIIEPTEPIIYEGDYSGKSKSLSPGRYGFDQLGIANDQLSSIKVPVGYKVTLYEGDAFEGRSLTLTNDARADYFVDKNFNNITSSLLVEVIPMVILYEGDYSGATKKLISGKYTGNNLGIGNDQLSSVRVPKGMRVILYDGNAFEGKQLTLTQDSGTDVIQGNGFNDITSSVIVEVIEIIPPMVKLFQDDFNGVSKQLPVGKYQPSQLGIANNTLSSISIPRGLQVSLYENDSFDGRAVILRSDASMNFFVANDFNDLTSSVIVEEVFGADHVIILYADQFSGPSQTVTPGRYRLKDLTIGDNQISSVRVPDGMRIVLHEDDLFKGYSLTSERDIDLTLSKMFNDRASSVTVEDLFTPIVSPIESKTIVTTPEVIPAKEPETVTVVPPCEMTSEQFENAYNAAKAKSWDDEKMTTAKLATKTSCLNNLQVRTMAGLFMGDDLTLDFLKYAHDLSKEKASYYLLEDVLKFNSTKVKFREFLSAK